MSLEDEDFLELVSICAWLHDVCDHKYIGSHPERRKAINELLFKLGRSDIILIKNIIKRISFTYEKSHPTENWYKILGSIGCLVRDIVSDADKLDAMGLDGLRRCESYAREKFAHNNPGITPDDDEIYRQETGC